MRFRGAPIDSQNKFGETALHLCSGQEPNQEMAKFLVMKGASALVKNQIGDTPSSIAKRCGNHELALLYSAQEQAS